MKQGKNFHKFAYSVMSLFVVILVGVIIYQQYMVKNISKKYEIGPMEQVASENNIRTSSEQNKKIGDIKSPSASDLKEIDELEYQLNAAEDELFMTRNQLADAIDKQSDLSELEKMMANTPEAKSRLRRSLKENLDRIYGTMFTRLGISGERLEEFKNIILDYHMAKQELIEKIDGDTMTIEDHIAVSQNIAAMDNEYQNEIEELFGEEAKNQFLSYEEKEGELSIASDFSEYLSETDELTEEQREKLVDSMSEARKTYVMKSLYNEDGTPIISIGVEEKEANIDLNIGIMESYLDSATTILSQSQLDKFKSYINKHIERYENMVYGQ